MVGEAERERLDGDCEEGADAGRTARGPLRPPSGRIRECGETRARRPCREGCDAGGLPWSRATTLRAFSSRRGPAGRRRSPGWSSGIRTGVRAARVPAARRRGAGRRGAGGVCGRVAGSWVVRSAARDVRGLAAGDRATSRAQRAPAQAARVPVLAEPWVDTPVPADPDVARLSTRRSWGCRWSSDWRTCWPKIHGLPLAIVAEIEGVPMGTVKSRLARAGLWHGAPAAGGAAAMTTDPLESLGTLAWRDARREAPSRRGSSSTYRSNRLAPPRSPAGLARTGSRDGCA